MKETRCLVDRVLVKLNQSNGNNGGVHIPDSIRKEYQTGEVVKVGPGREGYEMVSKLGDIAYFPPNVGTNITFEGVEHKVLREPEILLLK